MINEENNPRNIEDEMCGHLEASIIFIIAKFTGDMKSQFSQELSEKLLIEVLRILIDKFTDKSFGQ